MRHLFLGSIIIGATPFISNIAAATSWLNSLNINTVVPTGNFVCTKVHYRASDLCQQHTISLGNKGELNIKPHMFNQMANLVIPQWNIANQEIYNTNVAKNTQLIASESLKAQESVPIEPNQQNSSLDSSNENKKKFKNPNFPKFSRSSLLNSSSTTKLKFTHPAPDTTRVASSFGWRRRPYSGQYQFHKGIDYGAPLGTPVVAATDGIVTKVVSGCLDFRNRFCGNQFGNWIEVDHGNGAIALYGHLLYNSTTVKEGMKVWKNQEIARVGSSGWSTGAHLDFRVKVDGKYRNPAHFVR